VFQQTPVFLLTLKLAVRRGCCYNAIWVTW